MKYDEKRFVERTAQLVVKTILSCMNFTYQEKPYLFNERIDSISHLTAMAAHIARCLAEDVYGEGTSSGIQSQEVFANMEVHFHERGVLASEINKQVAETPLTAFLYFDCDIVNDETIDATKPNLNVLDSRFVPTPEFEATLLSGLDDESYFYTATKEYDEKEYSEEEDNPDDDVLMTIEGAKELISSGKMHNDSRLPLGFYKVRFKDWEEEDVHTHCDAKGFLRGVIYQDGKGEQFIAFPHWVCPGRLLDVLHNIDTLIKID